MIFHGSTVGSSCGAAGSSAARKRRTNSSAMSIVWPAISFMHHSPGPLLQRSFASGTPAIAFTHGGGRRPQHLDDLRGLAASDAIRRGGEERREHLEIARDAAARRADLGPRGFGNVAALGAAPEELRDDALGYVAMLAQALARPRQHIVRATALHHARPERLRGAPAASIAASASVDALYSARSDSNKFGSRRLGSGGTFERERPRAGGERERAQHLRHVEAPFFDRALGGGESGDGRAAVARDHAVEGLARLGVHALAPYSERADVLADARAVEAQVARVVVVVVDGDVQLVRRRHRAAAAGRRCRRCRSSRARAPSRCACSASTSAPCDRRPLARLVGVVRQHLDHRRAAVLVRA